MRTVHPLSSYRVDGDGGDASDASSISFGMSYGAADPAAAYDDPALWCHPSATPGTLPVVVPSQLSTLAILQAHHVPSQHGHPYDYVAQQGHQNGRSYHDQQPGSVHLTASCGIPTTYCAQQDIPLDGHTHIHTSATASAPSENRTALCGQDVSSFDVVPMSKITSQPYPSSQLHDTGVAASVQHFRGLPSRSATVSCPSFHPQAVPTAAYHDLTVPPPQFIEQNSATAAPFLERVHSFPSHRSASGPPSQHLDVPQRQSFAKPPRYLGSRHAHSPYASSVSLSPSPSSVISSLEASPVLPSDTRFAPSSRSASSRSSSATSSPFSTARHLHAAPTPSPPSSSARLTLPPSSDPSRFACMLCHGERTFSRTKDLERHVQSIHNSDPDAPRWVCCGVPLAEADRWGLPEWARREPPYMLNGVPMVGGCKEQCSRKDVLKRHLRKNESRCFGSENAPWLPGNHGCKRSPSLRPEGRAA